MWSNLILLHDDRRDSIKTEFENFLSWNTCMRSIYLSDDRLVDQAFIHNLSREYTVYRGFNAYSFLIEIVTGMHSKLFGESEIQAQFRDRFSEQNLGYSSLDLSLRKLRDQILEHTKIVRFEFLTSLGRQTYGSLTEIYIKKEKEIHLFGTGKLTEALLPYLTNKGRKVKVYGRNVARLTELSHLYNIESNLWEDYTPDSSPVIIASSHFPEEWIEKIKQASLIMDFREGISSEKGQLTKQYIPFSVFLDSIAQTEAHISNLKPIINRRIKNLTLEREEEPLHFMNGWEDIHCLSY